MRLGNCETDGVGKALTEGTRSDFDTWGIALYQKKERLLSY